VAIIKPDSAELTRSDEGRGLGVMITSARCHRSSGFVTFRLP